MLTYSLTDHPDGHPKLVEGSQPRFVQSMALLLYDESSRQAIILSTHQTQLTLGLRLFLLRLTGYDLLLLMQRTNLREYYRLLRNHFGHQNWWPGDTPIEICVGAILTQNTSWSNVEKAITNLKNANVLSVDALSILPQDRLSELIRPAGYFNVKAKRLKEFVRFINDSHDGNIDQMLGVDTSVLRTQLLSVNGIGPETADSILLYAGEKPIFVVDAYTKRVFSRHDIVSSEAVYNDIQQLFHAQLGTSDIPLFNDFHAQIVAVGKTYCKTRNPNCDQCPLRPLLPQPSHHNRRER